jgi:outer membrane biogenesis lipoprotein LolB/tetratricopeptide (TPR) repeat protein
VQLHLARALVSEKRYSEAKRQFEQLLLAYPNNPDVVYPVAMLALQENDVGTCREAAQAPADARFPAQECRLLLPRPDCRRRQAPDEALAYYRQVGPGEHYLPAQIRSAGNRRPLRQARRGAQPAAQAAASRPELRVQLDDRRSRAAARREADRGGTSNCSTANCSGSRNSPTCSTNRRCWPKRLGRMEVMESRLRKLIELQPDSAQAYNALGYSYADRNIRLARGAATDRKGAAWRPTTASFSTAWAGCSTVQGDLEGALSYLQRAYSQRPDAEIAAHLGEVLWMLGRKHEAQRILREAQKKDPANEVLSEAIRSSALTMAQRLTSTRDGWPPMQCRPPAPADLGLLLAACAGRLQHPATAPLRSPGGPAARPAARLLAGRPLFAAPRGQNHAGRIDWQHDGDATTLLLSSPFGQGMAEIVSDATGARLTTQRRQRAQTASSADELLQSVLGYPISLASCSTGCVAAIRTAAQLARDALGRPLQPAHEDWRIAYEYDSDDPQALPGRLFVEREGGFVLRLRIDEWQPLAARGCCR